MFTDVYTRSLRRSHSILKSWVLNLECPDMSRLWQCRGLMFLRLLKEVVTIDQEYVFGAPTRNIKEHIVSKPLQQLGPISPRIVMPRRPKSTTWEGGTGKFQKAALRTSWNASETPWWSSHVACRVSSSNDFLQTHRLGAILINLRCNMLGYVATDKIEPNMAEHVQTWKVDESWSTFTRFTRSNTDILRDPDASLKIFCIKAWRWRLYLTTHRSKMFQVQHCPLVI